MGAEHMQIGEVAERTGLSLRTIRYYDEMGIACPTARSQGGFRLYSEGDVERLQLVKRMKPLGFPLEDTRELLGILDRLEAGGADGPERRGLLERLEEYRSAAQARSVELRKRLEAAEDFTARLRSAQAEHGERT
nr:MerR family transcriptional regulator [Nocardiopsis chromatogenes]